MDFPLVSEWQTNLLLGALIYFLWSLKAIWKYEQRWNDVLYQLVMLTTTNKQLTEQLTDNANVIENVNSTKINLVLQLQSEIADLSSASLIHKEETCPHRKVVTAQYIEIQNMRRIEIKLQQAVSKIQLGAEQAKKIAEISKISAAKAIENLQIEINGMQRESCNKKKLQLQIETLNTQLKMKDEYIKRIDSDNSIKDADNKVKDNLLLNKEEMIVALEAQLQALRENRLSVENANSMVSALLHI